MLDWLLKHSYEITALSSMAMAAATIIMAAATAIYAIIAFRTLRQIRRSTAAGTLPALTLVEDTFSWSWPSGIFVEVKNTGFGPALDINTEIKGDFPALDINISKRTLGAGDTLRLGISARPIGISVTGSTPLFTDEMHGFRGELLISISYRGIFGGVYYLPVVFYIEQGRVEIR